MLFVFFMFASLLFSPLDSPGHLLSWKHTGDFQSSQPSSMLFIQFYIGEVSNFTVAPVSFCHSLMKQVCFLNLSFFTFIFIFLFLVI